MNPMRYTMQELADLVGGDVCGKTSTAIQQVAEVNGHVPPDSLVWINSTGLLTIAEQSGAACILAPLDVTTSRLPLIRVANPKLAFARILERLQPPARPPIGVHPSSVMGHNVTIGQDVSIAPHVVVGDEVVLGDRVVLGAGTVIGTGCVIGDDSWIYPKVTVYRQTRIGQQVIIHAGCVLGSEGFGYVVDPETRRNVKIPQVGHLVIEDHVEIGANVTIDRATLDSTIIRRGVKIDNQVHVAHNVVVGEETCLSAQVGIAGSSTIGDHCMLGGQVGIADHVTIESNVAIGGKAGVLTGKRVKQGQVVWGMPVRPLDDVKRESVALRKLPKLLKDVAAMREALEQAGIIRPDTERQHDTQHD